MSDCPYWNGARMAFRLARQCKREGDHKEAERHRERGRWYLSRRQIVREQIEQHERARREAA